jgi:curved DNA-binding protein
LEFKDYYKILGVDDSADEKTIKTAYRKLARKYHPDVSEENDAEDRFKEANEAWNVLKDADKRAEYDQIRQVGGQQHGHEFHPPPGWQNASESGYTSGFRDADEVYQGDYSDFFETLFGQGRNNRSGQSGYAQPRSQKTYSQRGNDIELSMPIMLEDSVKGYSDTISYNLPHYDEYGNRLEDVKKKLKINIPAGVTEGESVRLKGQGAPGIGDAESGDLYLKIKLVPHPLYDVEGHNLTITIPVAPWEAALGAKLTVPTLEGNISLTVPENAQSGKRLRIKGKGLTSRAGKGDLYAILKIVIPDNCNSDSIELWKKLSENTDFDPRTEWRNFL